MRDAAGTQNPLEPPGTQEPLGTEEPCFKILGPNLNTFVDSVLYSLFGLILKEPVVKEGIHPKYFDVEARCACGATWKTRSTKQELHLEICNNCHPFFTGRQKLIDTEGRVERFTKRFGAQTVESRKQAAKSKKQTVAAKA